MKMMTTPNSCNYQSSLFFFSFLTINIRYLVDQSYVNDEIENTKRGKQSFVVIFFFHIIQIKFMSIYAEDN